MRGGAPDRLADLIEPARVEGGLALQLHYPRGRQFFGLPDVRPFPEGLDGGRQLLKLLQIFCGSLCGDALADLGDPGQRGVRFRRDPLGRNGDGRLRCFGRRDRCLLRLGRQTDDRRRNEQRRPQGSNQERATRLVRFHGADGMVMSGMPESYPFTNGDGTSHERPSRRAPITLGSDLRRVSSRDSFGCPSNTIP